MTVSDGSRLEQLRAKRDEFADWLPGAAEELRRIPPGDARHQKFAEVRDAHGKIVQQIAELEQQQEVTGEKAGWEPGFLAWVEAGAIRDDVWKDASLPLAVTVDLLGVAIRRATDDAVVPSSCKSIIPGGAGALLTFGNLLWKYDEWLRQTLSEDEAAGALLARLRVWHRDFTERDWREWQPPAYPDAAEIEAAQALNEDVFPMPADRERLPRMTFQEARSMTSAISSAAAEQPSWWLFENGDAVYRAGRDQEVRVKISDIRAAGLDYSDCRQAMGDFDSDAVILFNLCVSLAEKGAAKGLPVDSLIGFLHWSPSSDEELRGMRDQIWKWLRLFGCMGVFSERRSQYKAGEEWIKPRCAGPLVIISRAEGDEGDLCTAPARVTITPGDFITRYHDNPKILTYFGDLQDVTAIRDADSSTRGRLAQMILMSLNQRWRELATSGKPFIHERRDLLDTACGITEKLLNSRNPSRTRDYFTNALNLLLEMRLIGGWRELDEPTKRRQGWAAIWLRQRVEVWPSEEGMRDVERLRAADQKRSGNIAKHRANAGQVGGDGQRGV